jgi:hypothetical protein
MYLLVFSGSLPLFWLNFGVITLLPGRYVLKIFHQGSLKREMTKVLTNQIKEVATHSRGDGSDA